MDKEKHKYRVYLSETKSIELTGNYIRVEENGACIEIVGNSDDKAVFSVNNIIGVVRIDP